MLTSVLCIFCVEIDGTQLAHRHMQHDWYLNFAGKLYLLLALGVSLLLPVQASRTTG